MNNKSNSNIISQSQNAALKQYQREINGASKAQEDLTQKSKLLERAMSAVQNEMNRTSGSLGSFAKTFVDIIPDKRVQLLVTSLAMVGDQCIAGAKESLAYHQALILTGDAAGKTAGQLQMMASVIGNSVGTQGQAAQAIQGLVGTGQFFGDEIKIYAEAAVQAQQHLGQSISTTVSKFEELGKNPVQASMKLNEQMHYLDLSTLEQIRSLQEQGRLQDAATLAWDKYANAINTGAPKASENLGYIGRAWKDASDMWDKGVDSLMSWGRETPLEELPAKHLQEIKNMQEELDWLEQNSSGSSSRANYLRNQITLNQMLIELGETKISQDQQQAKEQEENAKIQIEGQRASQSWTEARERLLTAEQRISRELEKQRQNLEKMRAAGYNPPLEDVKIVLGVRKNQLNQLPPMLLIQLPQPTASKKTVCIHSCCKLSNNFKICLMVLGIVKMRLRMHLIFGCKPMSKQSG